MHAYRETPDTHKSTVHWREFGAITGRWSRLGRGQEVVTGHTLRRHDDDDDDPAVCIPDTALLESVREYTQYELIPLQTVLYPYRTETTLRSHRLYRRFVCDARLQPIIIAETVGLPCSAHWVWFKLAWTTLSAHWYCIHNLRQQSWVIKQTTVRCSLCDLTVG